MLRGSVRRDVEEFVAARSERLLGTAYLLTGDQDRAEDLVQDGLAQAYAGWGRTERDPESAVRLAMVARHVAWWRRSRALSDGDDVADTLAHMSPRQRAVVVLRHHDGLSLEDTADAVGRSVAFVERIAAQPLGFPDLAAALSARADRARGVSAARRLEAVEQRALVRRARRRAGAAVGLVVVVAVVVLVVTRLSGGTSASPPPRIPQEKVHQPVAPPRLVGFQLPPELPENGVRYAYYRSKQSAVGSSSLRVLVPSADMPQQVAWASTSGSSGPSRATGSSGGPGRIVVRIDGQTVSRAPAGVLHVGVLISGDRRHVVDIRTTQPDSPVRLGVAIYHWPSS